MIFKSYLVEENPGILKNNIALIYGENLGLINTIKNIIKYRNKNNSILVFNQEEILKNHNILFNEIQNISLFEDKKIIFVNNINDKILQIIEELQPNINLNNVFLFANVLEKKSKIRSFFEKSDFCDIVPCYQDNEITIKKLINNELKDFNGVTGDVMSLLIDNTGLDRVKINNEIIKIQTYFEDKKITFNKLDKLLNSTMNDDFNKIRESIMGGDKNLTNKLLSTTLLESDKIPYYLSIINLRLNKIKEILLMSKEIGMIKAINNTKPPIFWKDKPNFTKQLKIWNVYKLRKALNKTFNFELSLKSNSNLDKMIILKKLLLDICFIACS
tara:strand:- start:1396 stop:2385 length:990 start_codon:yes stop_codon:yes gene_type:complete